MKKKRIAALAAAAALTLLLCSAASAADGAALAGKTPSGIAADGDGLLFTDLFSRVIWRLDGGTASRFAGRVMPAGPDGAPAAVYSDGEKDEAGFVEPWAIVPFMQGWAVSDAEANVIRYIDENGVYTLAGDGKSGLTDGKSVKARFNRPTGLACDGENLYIADTGNGCVRKMTDEGSVSVYASGLTEPTGLCWFGGALYAAETGKNRIVRIADGKTEVISGVAEPAEDDGVYLGGFVDGPAEKARFDAPQGVAADADGNIYVADTNNGAVRLIKDGRVYTLAPAADGSAAPIKPRGLLVSGGAVYVADLTGECVLAVETERGIYSDVPRGSFWAGYVEQADLRGMITGTGEGMFSPSRPVTRAEFLVMISRMHLCTDGSAVINGDKSFSDMLGEEWYAPAARWAADMGVTEGEAGGVFNASREIPRQQLVTMLYRYASANGYDVSASGGLDAFSDGGSVDGYARDAMSWAAASGIINGFDDGTLRPADGATRAQAVKILICFMDSLGL